ncbi:MAG: tyrosine-type recombinase/integrase [Gammaproteobacteria bacterium]|nr:tyrosine-type recombinase/integrase [Gammaproteobacteria bacterium]
MRQIAKRKRRRCGTLHRTSHGTLLHVKLHDLRHTWASWHVQQGTPLQVLQELGGWSDYAMVLRYAHLSVEHLAEYADNLSQSHLTGTNLAQSARKEESESRGDFITH